MSDIDTFRSKRFKGREARLFKEWDSIENFVRDSEEVFCVVRKTTPTGLPIRYEVIYNIRSFCGVSEPDGNGLRAPLYADQFVMQINIPNNYPSADAKLEFKFLTKTMAGVEIPHPWHPNIRYYGDFAGRVCLNADACGTFTDLSWYIRRVALYLHYEVYHAQVGVPPFPEDEKVAQWVTEQGEPNGWIEKLKKEH